MSEQDGYFSYIGLPGDFLAAVDPQQMEKLDMTASPGFIPLLFSLALMVISFTIWNLPSTPTPCQTRTCGGKTGYYNAKPAPVVAKPDTTTTKKPVPVAVKPLPPRQACSTRRRTEEVPIPRRTGDRRRIPPAIPRPEQTTGTSERYFAPLIQKLPNLDIVAVCGKDGQYYYVTQPFRTRSQALHWMRMINAIGWKIAYSNKKKPLIQIKCFVNERFY